MSEQGAWLPDPTGQHEMRFWDGTAWTAWVVDQGATATAPLDPAVTLPPPQPTILAAAAAAAPSQGPGHPAWRDLLDKVTDSGKELADRAKAAMAERDAPAAAGPVVAAPVAAAPVAAAPVPPAAAAPVDVASLAEQLRQLGSLRDDGLLTEEEFAAQKARLLGS